MTIVDPFLVPIPRRYLENKGEREYHERLIRTIDQLRQRTGGSTDEVSENSTRESYPWILDDLKTENITLSHESKSEEVHYHYETSQKGFRGVSVTSNYTAVPWDWVNAKNGAKVFMPQYPSDGDEVIVRNGDTRSIHIDGNGKEINDNDCIVIYRKGNSIRFKYFLDDNQWFGV